MAIFYFFLDGRRSKVWFSKREEEKTKQKKLKMIGELLSLPMAVATYRWFWAPLYEKIVDHCQAQGRRSSLMLALVHCSISMLYLVIQMSTSSLSFTGCMLLTFTQGYFLQHLSMKWKRVSDSAGCDIKEFGFTLLHHLITLPLLQGWMLMDGDAACRMFCLGEIPMIHIIRCQLTPVGQIDRLAVKLYLIFRVIGFPILLLCNAIERYGIWLLISPLCWIKLVLLAAVWLMNFKSYRQLCRLVVDTTRQ
jgi:hypothetical protein